MESSTQFEFETQSRIALSYAISAHTAQTDKSGMPYYMHPVRVGLSVAHFGLVYVTVGFLHDTVEDTSTTLDDIRNLFGADIASGVDAMSRRSDEKYFDYIKRAGSHPVGRIVKIADILDNMRPSRLHAQWEGMHTRYIKSLEMLQVPVPQSWCDHKAYRSVFSGVEILANL